MPKKKVNNWPRYMVYLGMGVVYVTALAKAPGGYLQVNQMLWGLGIGFVLVALGILWLLRTKR